MQIHEFKILLSLVRGKTTKWNELKIWMHAHYKVEEPFSEIGLQTTELQCKNQQHVLQDTLIVQSSENFNKLPSTESKLSCPVLQVS